jgi:signal transduction histidine kinase
MRAPERGHGLRFRLRHPQTTVRWRLTLLYGGLFFVSGAGLLAITYSLVAHASVTHGPFAQVTVEGRSLKGLPGPAQLPPSASSQSPKHAVGSGGGNVHVRAGAPSPNFPPGIVKLLKSRQGRFAILTVDNKQRISDLHQLVIESAIALAIMTLLCGALGWVVAGRVLLPLRTITASTYEISEANLHQRLAMPGPPDELRRLADTIDGLLERLEGAFDAQRRFVANASHELRTPLTAARAMLELVLSDPAATVDTFRDTCRLVLEESEHQEQLIDALLSLAQGQRGIDHREPLDLAAITAEVLETHELDATARAIELDASLAPAPFSGDRRLVERLVSNLVENAIRHNVANGSVRIRVAPQAGGAVLAMSNSGQQVPEGEVERLLQPFQRLTSERIGTGEGLGLGLSIVAAIADAHGAALDVRPGDDGGLEVEVRFPTAPASELPTPPGEDPVLAISLGGPSSELSS